MKTRLYRSKILFLFQLFTYLWLILNSAVAQEYQYFNKRLDLNGMSEIDRSYNILEVQDGYVIAGNSIVYSGNIYWSENVIAKLDFSGQFQSVNYYGEDSVDYWFLYTPNCLIHDQDHYYAARTRREPEH